MTHTGTDLKQQLIDEIVEVAHSLAGRLLEADDPSGARKAVLKGLQAEPGSELLLRDQIEALAAVKDLTGLRDLADRLDHRKGHYSVDANPEITSLLNRYLGS